MTPTLPAPWARLLSIGRRFLAASVMAAVPYGIALYGLENKPWDEALLILVLLALVSVGLVPGFRIGGLVGFAGMLAGPASLTLILAEVTDAAYHVTQAMLALMTLVSPLHLAGFVAGVVARRLMQRGRRRPPADG